MRPLDERGEQVRSDDVDRQDVWAGVDAGVVNDRVHPAELVHLNGDVARLLKIGQVPNHGRSAPFHEVTHGGEPVAVASVDDDLMPVVEQSPRSRPSQAICGAGDEDACDEIRSLVGVAAEHEKPQRPVPRIVADHALHVVKA
jgi:hypothetical protein